VPVGRRTALVLALTSAAGLMVFGWPLLVSGSSHEVDAPFVLLIVLPVLVLVVLTSLSEGGLDPKALAMLGVLAAVTAALRPLGAGAGGIELVFFLLVLSGRVFGAGFGFVLGALSLFASALITGGVGPWLPFQMIASAWVGLGAGLLPRRPRGRSEIALLVVYGVAASYVYGLLMNLWFWPFSVGEGTSVSFVAGDPLALNLQRFLVYTLTTSTAGWDTGRAVTTAVLLLVLGPAVLATLRRAHRLASFGAVPVHEPVREVAERAASPAVHPPVIVVSTVRRTVGDAHPGGRDPGLAETKATDVWQPSVPEEGAGS
jgi:energy-coupling factor transport system substrate-specific component